MSKVVTKSRMQELLDQGQSVWLDYLRRGMLASGELQRMIDDGLRGMTSNPTIFEHAIGGSTDYDEALARVASVSRTDREVFESLAVEDVRSAADLFRPVYDGSQGADGFVSLEVSPTLARDTAGTIAEARRLWAAVDRPNVMIKVPGTRDGWPAIERLLTDGINVNITLLFSLEHYREVVEAYLRALEARRKAGQPIDRVASVRRFSSVASIRRLIDVWMRRRRLRGTSAAKSRSQTRSSRMHGSERCSTGHAGGRSPPRGGPSLSVCCGQALAPRTPPTRMCYTWIPLLVRTRSTPCRRRPCSCSRITAPCGGRYRVMQRKPDGSWTASRR